MRIATDEAMQINAPPIIGIPAKASQKAADIAMMDAALRQQN
jgi:hypothetical protein